MTTPLSEITYEDMTSNFDGLLAEAHAADLGETPAEPEVDAPDPDAETPEDGDAVEDIDAGDDMEEAEDDNAEPEPEDEPEIDPSIGKSVKYFKEQAKRESERAAIAEARYNELIKAIEAMATQSPKAQPEPKQEFEPLDEEAHRLYTQKQQELEMRLTHQSFVSALQQQETAARAAHPDFDNAFAHLQNVEVAKLKAMGVTDQIAKEEVTAAMGRTAFAAWQQGRDVGKMFYDMANSIGYRPTKGKPADINPDAIQKNKARTETKPVKGVSAEVGGGALQSRLQNAFKDGRVDPEQFQKLLKEYRGS